VAQVDLTALDGDRFFGQEQCNPPGTDGGAEGVKRCHGSFRLIGWALAQCDGSTARFARVLLNGAGTTAWYAGCPSGALLSPSTLEFAGLLERRKLFLRDALQGLTGFRTRYRLYMEDGTR